MSWSLEFIGKPEIVSRALNEYSEKLTGESQKEYNDAKEHLIALVSQNCGEAFQNSNYIEIKANGHGYLNNRNLNVSIRQVYIPLI